MTISRYDDTPPSANVEGDVLEACLYAGTGCGRISDVPEAAQIMDDIWAEYQAISGIRNEEAK